MHTERTCHRCNRVLAGSGRRSASGLYWCRDKDCQKARAKWNYAQEVKQDQAPDAPTKCANPACGADLAPRKIRAGDSPLGRWCNRIPCRRHRQATLANPLGIASGAILAEMVTQLSQALVWGRAECPSCGRTDALAGYPHYDYDGEKCYALGRASLKKQVAQALWPNELGAPDGCSPEEYARLTATSDRPQEVHPA